MQEDSEVEDMGPEEMAELQAGIRLARLKSLYIRGYRSIRDEIILEMPEGQPLVLVGENNSGKSNIVRAFDLILGESWPGSRKPEDHEFWGRNQDNGPIKIVAHFDRLQFVNTQTKQQEGEINCLLWEYNPDSVDEACTFRAIMKNNLRKYVNNLIREQCACIVIGAERRLSYELSYITKWTLLSKLMRKFHDRLTSDNARVNRLKDKFTEVKGIFDEVSEFQGFQEKLQEEFHQMFSGMTYGLEIDFSAYDPSSFFHALKVMPHEDGQPRTFEELGTGQEQVLALVFAHAYAKAFYGGILLIIEEPEAHLHPLAQQWLANNIRRMAQDGLQIVITTHSPAFIDVLGLEGIVAVRKTDNSTTIKNLKVKDLIKFCKDHGADPSRTSENTILPFYADNATPEIVSGFFAKKVVLVEGHSEQLALPIYFEKIGLDVLKEGISIIPVMGKGNIAKWWRFFSAYDIPVFVIFDNDMEDDQQRTKRQDILHTLGIASDIAQKLISTDEWIIGDRYCVFGKDFEQTLRKYFSCYQKLEEQAGIIIGDAKPLKARLVAQRIAENKEFDNLPGWDKFRGLKANIEILERV